MIQLIPLIQLVTAPFSTLNLVKTRQISLKQCFSLQLADRFPCGAFKRFRLNSNRFSKNGHYDKLIINYEIFILDEYILTIFVLLLIWLWFKSLHLGTEFVIRISPGRVIVKKGEPPKDFIKESKLILRHEIIRGSIYAYRDDNGIKLEFSPSIKDYQAQRFRNIFPYDRYLVKHPKGPDKNDTTKVKAK